MVADCMYNNSLNFQSVTLHYLSKHRAQKNLTFPTDSSKEVSNKKLFAIAEALIEKVCFFLVLSFKNRIF